MQLADAGETWRDRGACGQIDTIDRPAAFEPPSHAETTTPPEDVAPVERHATVLARRTGDLEDAAVSDACYPLAREAEGLETGAASYLDASRARE